MTTIQEVYVTGLKGADAHTVRLSAATLLTGRVGSGKTLVADAITFGFLGCVPRVGLANAATARLMTGRELSVSITLSDGRVISRSLKRVGRKLEQHATASWMPDGKPTEVGAAIRSLAGIDATEAAENLDITRLLTRSGADLARVVDALLAGAGLTPEKRAEETAELWEKRIEGQREKVDGLLQPLTDADEASMKRLEPMLRDQAAAGLASCVEWVGQEKRDAASVIRKQQAAADEMRARASEIRSPAKSATAIAEESEAARDRMSRAQTELAQAEKTLAAKVEAEKVNTTALEVLAHADDVMQAAREEAPIAHEARETMAKVQNPGLPNRTQTDPQQRERVQQAREAVTDAEQKMFEHQRPEVITLDREQNTVEAMRREAERLESSPWHRVREIAERLPESCIPERKELLRLATEHGGSLADAQAAMITAQAELSTREQAALERQKEIDAAERAFATLVANRDTAVQGRTAAEAALQESTDTAEQTYREAMEQYTQVCSENTTKRDELREASERIEAAITAAESEYKAAYARMRETQARLKGLTESVDVDVDTRREIIAAAVETIADNEQALESARQAEAVQSEITRLLNAVAAAASDERCYAAAEWAVKRIRDKDMEAKSSGLESRLKRFLSAAGRPEQPYFSTSRGSASFGWRLEDGTEVDLRAMSSGETVIYRGALAYAILLARAPEIRLLMLEVAEAADHETAEALLEAGGAITDELQVLAASCAPVSAPEGWVVISRDKVVATT